MAQFEFRDVLALVGTVLGFFSGWGVSALTERQKRRVAYEALRDALIAELRHTEVLLCTVVTKYAFLAESQGDKARVAAEWRWFARVGAPRAQEAGLGMVPVPEGMLDHIAEVSDNDIVNLIVANTSVETVGSKLILPVLDSVLAGRTAGFSATAIQALSTVRWQAFLLDQDADWTAEFLRYTFTITDQQNYDIVSENHRRRRNAYAYRAGVLLNCTRAALKGLGAPDE